MITTLLGTKVNALLAPRSLSFHPHPAPWSCIRLSAAYFIPQRDLYTLI